MKKGFKCTIGQEGKEWGLRKYLKMPHTQFLNVAQAFRCFLSEKEEHVHKYYSLNTFFLQNTVISVSVNLNGRIIQTLCSKFTGGGL